MKKRLSIGLAILVSIFMVFSSVSVPAYASSEDSNCVETAILFGGGEVCDDGTGQNIIKFLELVVEIMTIGVGILGVIGITISGIQYLTAGGNEEKTRKAKRRIFEIVIGLVVYALFYAILTWLNISPPSG